jgi:hypothetical protein
MRRSAFVTTSWVLAGAFFLGAVLFALDRLNVVATPPTFPDTANLVDRILGSFGYRQAIWPVYLGTNLLFAIGFGAIVPFAGMLGEQSRDAGASRWIAVGLLAVAGIVGAVASLLIIGAVDVTIATPYCDCGFKETEVVSQSWALSLLSGAHDWLLRGALAAAGLGLFASLRLLPAAASSSLKLLTQVTGLVLIVSVVAQALGALDPLPDLLTGLSAGILVPAWVALTARTVSATTDRSSAG